MQPLPATASRNRLRQLPRALQAMPRIFGMALALLLSCLPLHAADPVPADLQLILLIGQSNMAGRGTVEPQDQVIHPRIFMLNKEKQWVPAQDPVHFDKPVAGVGLCSEFARILARENPSAHIGLIPCAVGGTSLDQWSPGGALYLAAIERARAALKQGKLTAILWHQGEADRAPEKMATYGDRFSALITQLRKDLNADAVPVIIGELGHFRETSIPFNAQLPEVARRVPHCALVTAEELKDIGDQTHFDAASQRTFGARYAAAFRKLTAKP